MNTRLLEREGSLAILDALMAKSAAGSGQIALVSGEAGVGKSSLVDAFVARHRSSATCLWGACDALFTPRPLGPLYDITLQSGGRVRELLEGSADRSTLFAAFQEELQRSARPVLVLFEDVHWADEATLDLIKFLGRRIHQAPALLILTYRDDEVGASHPLSAVLGDLPARSATRVRLQPLSPASIAQLAGEQPHAEIDLARLYAVTGGNPFFVTEALASETPGVPVSVRDAVLARASRLSPQAHATLHLVAVTPGRMERWIVDAIGGDEQSGIEECLASGMLRQESDALAFRHELARLAIESTLTTSRLRTLHARVLHVLLSVPQEPANIAHIVHHAAQAEDRKTVQRYAPLAARQAAAQGAHREAAAHYRTALRFDDNTDAHTRAELLEGLAYECYLTSHVAEAAQAREEALTLWKRLDQPEKVGLTLRWLSRLSWYLGHDAEATRYADQAIALLSTLPPGKELAMAYSNRSQVYMLMDDMANTVQWGNRAIELAEQLGAAEILCHALNNVGTVEQALLGSAGEQKLLRSLHMALELGLEEHVARAYTNLVAVPVLSYDHPRAGRYLADGIAFCDEHDIDSWSYYMRAWRARERLNLGDWSGAEEDTTAILARQVLPGATRIPALIALGWLRVRRGDPGAAAVLDEARDLAFTTGEVQRIAPVSSARAEAAWLRGDLTACAAEARAGFSIAQEHPAVMGAAQLAFWLWRAGEPPDSAHAAATPFALQMSGDWQAAAAEWERLECPYERGLALLDGDTEAQRTALDLFERLGAQPAAERARQALRHSGARGLPRGPHAATRANPVGLTNRQLEILTLLVQGLRNAEIAERLYASPKTIEHHVSAVLAKLGVRSRSEAITAALAMGLIAE